MSPNQSFPNRLKVFDLSCKTKKTFFSTEFYFVTVKRKRKQFFLKKKKV